MLQAAALAPVVKTGESEDVGTRVRLHCDGTGLCRAQIWRRRAPLEPWTPRSLRNGVLAFQRHWHPAAMPPALRRVTQAPRPRSARAPLDLVMVVAGYHPPTRTYVSHLRATPGPSALGESG